MGVDGNQVAITVAYISTHRGYDNLVHEPRAEMFDDRDPFGRSGHRSILDVQHGGRSPII